MTHTGRMSRSLRSRHVGTWLSLTMRTLPQRSHSMRRNQDGKALNGSSRGSATSLSRNE